MGRLSPVPSLAGAIRSAGLRLGCGSLAAAAHLGAGRQGLPLAGPSRIGAGMSGWWVAALGTAAGLCTTGSFVPQVVKAWREGDTRALSLRMYLALSAAILRLKLREGRRAGPGRAARARGRQA